MAPWVLEMSAGMRLTCRQRDRDGRLRLRDLPELERYCGYVAGTGGALLTGLFRAEVPTAAVPPAVRGDAGWSFASPADLITRGKFAKDKALLQAAIATRPTAGIVIGLPINMDGSESPRSQSSRSFARNLLDLALPILLWDERWSTAAAERFMIEADLSRAKRAERIDSAAAAHILQGAIDALVA